MTTLQRKIYQKYRVVWINQVQRRQVLQASKLETKNKNWQLNLDYLTDDSTSPRIEPQILH